MKKLLFPLLCAVSIYISYVPAGIAANFPQYDAIIDASGERGTYSRWPRDILWLAWNQCDDHQCDGKWLCVYSTTVTVVCGQSQACSYPVNVRVKFDGSYSGGIAQRDNWIKALLEFSDQGNYWWVGFPYYDWRMRNWWAIRSPHNSDWINVQLEEHSTCD